MKFPPHKCGLYLTHNEHKDLYQTLEEWYEDQADNYDLLPSEFAECLEANEFWSLHWYPETPVGFYTAAASSLEKLLEKANKFSG
jgi:hypothetical protein